MNRIVSMALAAATALAAIACASKEGAKPAAAKCMITCTDPGRLVCDPVRQQCFECVQDSDCDLRPLGGACVQAGNFCGCNTNADCAGSTLGAKCLGTHTCGCDDRPDCAAAAAGPACVVSTHSCGCGEDVDCTSLSAKRCNPTTGTCGQCFSSAMCTDPDLAACKTSDFTCVPCAGRSGLREELVRSALCEFGMPVHDGQRMCREPARSPLRAGSVDDGVRMPNGGRVRVERVRFDVRALVRPRVRVVRLRCRHPLRVAHEVRFGLRPLQGALRHVVSRWTRLR